MKQKWFTGITKTLFMVLILQSTGLTLYAQQQRPRRAIESIAPEVKIVPGSRILPVGYVLVLRMESKLDSGVNRPGDRFIARLDEAITDEFGSMVLPANLVVAGHLTEVAPAQMRRRSGVISVTFDTIQMVDGRELPLRGVLTSADPKERQNLRAEESESVLLPSGNNAKRNTVFIGGGAATGAVIGAIAGGAALGAGIGAAAGLVAVLLAKGKEAVIEPGTLIGVELIDKLDLTQTGNYVPRPLPARPSQPNTTPQNPIQNGTPSNPTPNTPTFVQEPQLMKLSFVQAERITGGSILVVATADAPSSNWKVKTETQINQDTLEVWVKGTPPEGRSVKGPTHPTVTTSVADPKGMIRRVIVHGATGDRSITLPRTTS